MHSWEIEYSREVWMHYSCNVFVTMSSIMHRHIAFSLAFFIGYRFPKFNLCGLEELPSEVIRTQGVAVRFVLCAIAGNTKVDTLDAHPYNCCG